MLGRAMVDDSDARGMGQWQGRPKDHRHSKSTEHQISENILAADMNLRDCGIQIGQRQCQECYFR